MLLADGTIPISRCGFVTLLWYDEFVAEVCAFSSLSRDEIVCDQSWQASVHLPAQN